MHHPLPAARPGSETPLRRGAAACGALCLAFALACGGHHSDSAAATTTTTSPAPIVVQPQDALVSSSAPSQPSTATFSVLASGNGTLSYQWYRIPTTGGTAAAIASATGPTYTTPALATTDSGSLYYVTVTSQLGVVTSRSAVLTVIAQGGVSTFAGAAGSPGAGDGLGTAAHFSAPFGIANDGHGVFFVADTDNHTIRRIDASQNVTTFAGTAGVSGFTNANGTSASFNQPTGLAIDAAGNLFVSDSGNRVIRKITPAGDVTTFAGSGAYGSADGAFDQATFAYPQGIVVDGTGTLYVADAFNGTIRKVTASGAVSTLAGSPGSWGSADGAGTSATFNQPMGLALDATGNLFVADSNNHTIRKVTSGGVVTTVAGAAGKTGLLDGTGTVATFHTPLGVAVDATGNLYITDSGNRCVRVMSAAAAVTTQAGSPFNAGSADGLGLAATFGLPCGLTVSGGNVYLVDATYGTIRKLIPGT